MKAFAIIVSLGFCAIFSPNISAGDSEQNDLVAGSDAPDFFMGTYNPEASGVKRFFLDKIVGPDATDKKKLLLLSFFEIDCKPCKKELPFLQKLFVKYRDSGLAVVVVNCDHEKEKISQAIEYIKKSGYTFPVLKDRFQALQRRYHIRSFPTMFFVGSDGKILHVRVGYNEKKKPFPMKKFKELLGLDSRSLDASSN